MYPQEIQYKKHKLYLSIETIKIKKTVPFGKVQYSSDKNTLPSKKVHSLTLFTICRRWKRQSRRRKQSSDN